MVIKEYCLGQGFLTRGARSVCRGCGAWMLSH